jgi:hypothetical protein
MEEGSLGLSVDEIVAELCFRIFSDISIFCSSVALHESSCLRDTTLRNIVRPSPAIPHED